MFRSFNKLIVDLRATAAPPIAGSSGLQTIFRALREKKAGQCRHEPQPEYYRTSAMETGHPDEAKKKRMKALKPPRKTYSWIIKPTGRNESRRCRLEKTKQRISVRATVLHLIEAWIWVLTLLVPVACLLPTIVNLANH